MIGVEIYKLISLIAVGAKRRELNTSRYKSGQASSIFYSNKLQLQNKTESETLSTCQHFINEVQIGKIQRHYFST